MTQTGLPNTPEYAAPCLQVYGGLANCMSTPPVCLLFYFYYIFIIKS